MSDGKESHSVYSSAPLSPMRSEEFDYQQSNITLLKVSSLKGMKCFYPMTFLLEITFKEFI